MISGYQTQAGFDGAINWVLFKPSYVTAINLGFQIVSGSAKFWNVKVAIRMSEMQPLQNINF